MCCFHYCEFIELEMHSINKSSWMNHKLKKKFFCSQWNSWYCIHSREIVEIFVNNYETVIRNIAASIQRILIIARLIIDWISISKSKSESILQWSNDLGKICEINQSENAGQLFITLWYLLLQHNLYFLYLFHAYNSFFVFEWCLVYDMIK